MHYVYLLQLGTGKVYTGKTDNLKRRVKEHQANQVTSTKNQQPIKLIYYEAYLQKTDATARELYLKTGDGRKNVRKQLRNYFNMALSSNG